MEQQSPQPQSSGMSRKAFGAGMAITAIVSVNMDSENAIQKLAAIVIVALIAIGVQGILDWRK